MENTNQKLDELLPSETTFQKFIKYFIVIAIIVLAYVIRHFEGKYTELDERYKKHLEEDAKEWKTNGLLWNELQRKVYTDSSYR